LKTFRKKEYTIGIGDLKMNLAIYEFLIFGFVF
jgi:hypothetical protein